MAGSHSRLVAVQAVVVGVLLVVVFVTLLQPEAQMPISSVQGPAGGSGGTQLPAPEIYTGAENKPDAEPDDPREPGGGPSEPPPSGTEGLGLTDPPSVPEDTEILPPEDEPEKPSDDQYADSLTRLILRVN